MRKQVFDGNTHHSIDHLSPFTFTVKRPASGNKIGWEKQIHVSFSWHCYTRTPDHDEQVYLLRNRHEVRCFCPERYLLSQRLPDIIRSFEERVIFQTGKGNYITVEVVDTHGVRHDYGVFFDIRKGQARDPLKLYISSAYPFDAAQKRYQVARQKIKFRVIVYNIIHGKRTKPSY